MDPNALNLDPYPGYWLDPDPGYWQNLDPGPDSGLKNQFWRKKFKNLIFYEVYFYKFMNKFVSLFWSSWVFHFNLYLHVSRKLLYTDPIRIRIRNTCLVHWIVPWCVFWLDYINDEAILPTFAVSTGDMFYDGPIPWMSDKNDMNCGHIWPNPFLSLYFSSRYRRFTELMTFLRQHGDAIWKCNFLT